MFGRRVLDVRYNFWFLPSLMALAAITLALVFGAIDRALGLETGGWLLVDEAEGARQLLSVVAASMATVAGVVFSVTILTLSMASAEFGPRLLRNFMRDRGTQVVLGTFTSTFLYSLVVLTRVRTGDDAAVPQLSLAWRSAWPSSASAC